VQWRAVFHLGQRMAWRNNLYLFAWLCAVALPVILQVIAGLTEDARVFLGDYFGFVSLYIFFAMTFGFATVFVSYYQVNGYRQAGTVDLLRTANFRPGAILLGAFLQLQAILIPPVLLFCTGMLVYLQFDTASWGWLRGATPRAALEFVLMLVLIQAALSALPLLGLFRRAEWLGLAGMLVVLPLNLVPLFVSRSRSGTLLPGLLVLAALAGLLLLAGWWRLSRLWPPLRSATLT
jgi:hypothetical protein